MFIKGPLATATFLVSCCVAAPAMCAATPPFGSDWITKDVCADISNRPVAADPYYGCPAGTTQRDIAEGEELPYINHDQPGPNGDHPNGYQRRDAYPVTDLSGNPLVVNEYDFDYFQPYFTFEAGDGDGYDLYSIRNGWVSATQTRDGGGYSQTFYGSGCTPYNGWVFFPTSILSTLSPDTSGSTTMAIMDDYWERNGQSWPGVCNVFSNFNRNTITSWEFKPQFAFGGINGAPIKYIDTIVSSHGYSNDPSFVTSGHIETFYFTKLYGVTRWEAWYPTQQNRPPQGVVTCNGSSTTVYQGIPMTRADCRDWSATQVIALAVHPVWPVPDLNLLSNFHFSGSLSPWKTTGSAITAAVATSTTQADRHVFYLSLGCRGACQPGQMIYQDIPISKVTSGTPYDYAIAAVSHGAAGGTLEVSLNQVDSKGRILDERSFVMTVPTAAMTVGGSMTDAVSVYRAATFTGGTTSPLYLRPGARSLRFGIEPQSMITFDIVDAWVMPRASVP
jgi:hypothetical protein